MPATDGGLPDSLGHLSTARRATEKSTQAAKQEIAERKQREKEKRKALRRQVSEKTAVAVNADGRAFERSGKGAHGSKAALAKLVRKEGEAAGYVVSGRDLLSLYPQVEVTTDLDAKSTIIAIDAQRFGVLAPRGLKQTSTVEDALSKLLLAMLRHGKALVVQRKSPAVFYFLDTPRHDHAVRSLAAAYRAKSTASAAFQALSGAARAQLGDRLGSIPETWRELWGQKLGGRENFMVLLHVVAGSSNFQQLAQSLRLGNRTTHVIVGGTNTGTFFTVARTSSSRPAEALAIAGTTVALRALLSTPRCIVKHAEGENEAVAFAMNLVDTFAPAVLQEVQDASDEFGSDLQPNPMTIVIDAADSDVLLGMAPALVDYAVKRGYRDVVRLLLLPHRVAGAGAPQSIINLRQMYEHFEDNDALPCGAPGSRALSLSAIFAMGCNDLIVAMRRISPIHLYKAFKSSLYASGFAAEGRKHHGHRTWNATKTEALVAWKDNSQASPPELVLANFLRLHVVAWALLPKMRSFAPTLQPWDIAYIQLRALLTVLLDTSFPSVVQLHLRFGRVLAAWFVLVQARYVADPTLLPAHGQEVSAFLFSADRSVCTGERARLPVAVKGHDSLLTVWPAAVLQTPLSSLRPLWLEYHAHKSIARTGQ